MIHGYSEETLERLRDRFHPGRSLEWVAGSQEGFVRDRARLGQGDDDFDAGWYQGYVTTCKLVAERSGIPVPKSNRDYWDHVGPGRAG